MGDFLCWASTATDNWSDCNGVLVYFLEKIKLLCPGWGFFWKEEIFFCSWVYDTFLVHRLYVCVDGFAKRFCGVCGNFFINVLV